MSLSFLSKKTWHTKRTDNVEQVWKAEQKREKEDKKLKELQKQIDEERQIEELRTMQKDAGLVTDPKQKLEWMYEGPGSAIASEAQAREYKLGKEYVPTQQSAEMDALESKKAAGSTWLDNTASNENELFSRLNQDPLYAMRQSQKRDREKQVLQNPLAMKRMRASIREELTSFEQQRLVKKAAKRAKKEEKKAKKRSKKEKKKKRSRSPSPAPASSAPARREGFGLQKGEKGAAGRDTGALGPAADLVRARERAEAERRRRPEKVALTEEEKERRRREMAADGAAHDARRYERLEGHRGNSAKEAVAADEAELRGRAAGGDSSFLRKTRAEAYVGGGDTLGDRIGKTRGRVDKRAARDEDP